MIKRNNRIMAHRPVAGSHGQGGLDDDAVWYPTTATQPLPWLRFSLSLHCVLIPIALFRCPLQGIPPAKPGRGERAHHTVPALDHSENREPGSTFDMVFVEHCEQR